MAADPAPILLWGDWRPSANPDFYTAECAACGGSLWVWRPTRYEDEPAGAWRVTCENGCAREEIEARAAVLLEEQRASQRYADELKATMDPSDPFYTLKATDYIAALTGQEPTRAGFFLCPFHEERTPSLHATDLLPGRWHCFGCGGGGTIYDFAALLWGIEPRRDGFVEIRTRLARELLKGTGGPLLYLADEL